MLRSRVPTFHGLCLGLAAASVVLGLKYDPGYVDWNLNQNQKATDPLEYWGQWRETLHPSPKNWRFPFYTLFLDRFVNGDPFNDDINGTQFEQEILGTQMRFGGDVQGLADSLDYLQGMGVRGLYIAGSPMINQPWQYDSYSPLDHTLLDQHFGNITVWRQAVDDIHRRGMYIILDNTVATMGDLIGFENYLNDSAPFRPDHEHKALWKTSRQYNDFSFGTEWNDSCKIPRFYLEDGKEVEQWVYDSFGGCYDGDFDQYGDTEAFGVYLDYRRQTTKFASVQDRLREWVPSVRERIERMSCITIAMLDIDGFRYDKATQVTVDAEGRFSSYLRHCAAKLGKTNFFLPGEITGGNAMGSIYIGRGRQPPQYMHDIQKAANLTSVTATHQDLFIRDEGQQALDSAAFHYSIYRNLLRFLGMDGNMAAANDLPLNWVSAWNKMLLTNDFLNPSTGIVDPRHMYGASNQDVFRWPAIIWGVERNLLGLFITTLHMPGIPLLLWGEEQAYYVLDNTASNYMFGRQPIASSPAWYTHGCYKVPATLYFDMPLIAAHQGCSDETVSYDHRDPSHWVRNIIRHQYFLREQYSVLQDGFYLQSLSNHTKMMYYPGSSGVGTETGLWSVMRAPFFGIQELEGETTPVWFLYHNANVTTTYKFDCSDEDSAVISPFDAGTTVRNLMMPHQEMTLVSSSKKLKINESTEFNGCVPELTMKPFEYRVFVPTAKWVAPPAMLTRFSPGHDWRMLTEKESNTVRIEFHASAEMDCTNFTRSINILSTTISGLTPKIDVATVLCNNMSVPASNYTGAIASAWSWAANITDLAPGIHRFTVNSPRTVDGRSSTNSTDHFLIRLGASHNPMVFPLSANYSSTLVTRRKDGKFDLNHAATGATHFRYTTNWQSSWSNWMLYEERSTVEPLEWSGSKDQAWIGAHVQVQYYNRILGSSGHFQHGDADYEGHQRRFPHLFAAGPFNQYGYDGGLHNMFELSGDSTWTWHFMDEWPSTLQVSVWGMNPDGEPDRSFVYGDLDGDGVLDRLPPSSLSETTINITSFPPKPSLAYRIEVNDATWRYAMVPVGNMWVQLTIYILLWIMPVIGGIAAVVVFKRSFYKIKFNELGNTGVSRLGRLGTEVKNWIKTNAIAPVFIMLGKSTNVSAPYSNLPDHSGKMSSRRALALAAGGKRRVVLLATMEYNIDDWEIKIKIGGLGVMAQLMSKALPHQDLVWVVPCVGDVEYPVDTPEEPIFVTIMEKPYEISVQCHRVENITYVLLDAPIFRKQTKAVPYPPRMDDMESAIYYSAWNQCIAEMLKRFPIDMYHINDYHGAAGPLYLLPQTIPCALSLHNAEFQGMWPMRTPHEIKEVCSVFNLSQEVVKDYVQFGSVFNLLHAAASYLRIHQNGFGAVGVSKKYGSRSFARYPIFWGLSKVGQLPNPDPTDTAEWSETDLTTTTVKINAEWEASRKELKLQAQNWAGLEQNSAAELFVFVGRWSLQKGVDLIADIFPWVLENYADAQLICIGPVIDLYGRFAAVKLDKLMEKYPGRVFSKPEFTSLPPYIFSGAEFALIPSRDEPFGLVAVEFGRKGALSVGARVGGLGQMPGWWFTVESTRASHLLGQFKHAITAALASDQATRARMRAYAANQRFPVAQWLRKLETLQTRVIKVSTRHAKKAKGKTLQKSRPAEKKAGPELGLNIEMDERPSGYDPLPAPGLGLNLGFDSPPYHSGHNSPLYGGTPDASNPGTPNWGSITPSPIGSPIPTRPGSPTGSAYNYPDEPMHSRVVSDTIRSSYVLSPDVSATSNHMMLGPNDYLGLHQNGSRASLLSLPEVVGNRLDFQLQQVDPFFTDATGEFQHAFEAKLDALTPKNSTSDLCIEDYLIKSEKQWFDQYRDAKLGRRSHSRRNSFSGSSRTGSRGASPMPHGRSGLAQEATTDQSDKEQFGIGDGYIPPTGLRKYLQLRIGEWPFYAILLALGQIIASNSYQIALLSGDIGQTAEKLYVIASIYLVTSVAWYTMSRTMWLLYPLSLPFVFYGLAFLVLGISPFMPSPTAQTWMQNVATGLYAAASSSGGLAFAFNFGTDGGSPVSTWVIRLAVIQGLSQLYTMGLWGWGSVNIAASAQGRTVATYSLSSSSYLAAVCIPVAVLLWAVGIMLFVGLPDFYREQPGPVPQLWKTLLRRRTIAWYLCAIVIQNYFLSTLVGRSWSFMFASNHLPLWGAVILALFFFIFGWATILCVLGNASQTHPWLFPMFGIGLGAPRWAQIFWATSRLGLYLPWAGPIVGAALSRALWLWLGLLDGVQGAGIGMILMLTLTRVHVAAAVAAAQVLGSLATIAGRVSAPDSKGPGDLFPDFSRGLDYALRQTWFWVVLVLQLGICVGYLKFFRKEQVSKP